MASVKLESVNKYYDSGSHAVIDFNLQIEEHEFIVLVGPSGCGKSTTLRMIAGLENISSGSVFIGERCVNDLPPKDRDIAMVFQNYALYPHMSVFENLAFGLKLRGLAKVDIKERVNDAARILGLGSLLDRLPKQLSGGQRQRVALGRAIVRKPSVFLFDEPLSNLDAKMRVEMRSEINRLHNRLNATMIYVTHDQTEAMTLGDRIVVMNEGRIQQVADPLTLYNVPANIFAAGFIGTPPMNLLPGDLFGDGSLIAGFRPEDITVADGCAQTTLSGVVDFVEPMGSETYLHLKVHDLPVVVRVAPDKIVNSGDNVKIAVDLQKCSFFNKSTGIRQSSSLHN